MLIRPFTHRDIAPACRLTNHYILHTTVHFGAQPLTDAEFGATWPRHDEDDAPATAPDPDIAAATDRLAAPRAGAPDAAAHDPAPPFKPRFPWLAAEQGGDFAGYAKSGTWRARDAYARTAEVTVYVEPACHRMGVGRALYTALLALLKARGFHTAIGGITLPNPGSVGLHEAMGFRHVGTFREVGRKFAAWHDVGFWQLMLV